VERATAQIPALNPEVNAERFEDQFIRLGIAKARNRSCPADSGRVEEPLQIPMRVLRRGAVPMLSSHATAHLTETEDAFTDLEVSLCDESVVATPEMLDLFRESRKHHRLLNRL